MPSPRKPLSVPWIGVAVLAVLMGGYVSAYYATVEPEGPFLETDAGGGWDFLCKPQYAIASSVAIRVFAPVHWLDMRLRPRVWRPGLH
jgi:hypothetical protein